jgi:hypothetical protein
VLLAEMLASFLETGFRKAHEGPFHINPESVHTKFMKLALIAYSGTLHMQLGQLTLLNSLKFVSISKHGIDSLCITRGCMSGEILMVFM